MMGQLAALDNYDPNADYPLSSDGITQRITARDDTVQPMQQRVRNFENSPFGLMLDHYKAAPKDVWKKNDPLPFIGLTPAQIEEQGANFSMPDKFIRDMVIPQSIGEAGMMLATGGFGKPAARVATGVLGALAEMTDPAQAGVLDKLLKPIRAYHGSPHNFEKFDASKIGTGEGNQAYGHGLYFGGAEPTAESYTNAQWKYGPTKAQTIYDRLYEPRMERGLDNEGWSKLNAQRGFWERVVLGRSPRQVIMDAHANPDQYGANELAYITSLKPDKFSRIPGSGHMYEVNINADPAKMLNWDAPIAQQPKAVQDALHPDFIKMREAIAAGQKPDRAARDYAFNPLYGMVDQGGVAYQALADRSRGGYAEATKKFRDAGAPGIRYLDQGSRDAGQGTSNYVMFDDRLIDIMRKYGLAGLTGGGGVMGTLAAPDNYRQ